MGEQVDSVNITEVERGLRFGRGVVGKLTTREMLLKHLDKQIIRALALNPELADQTLFELTIVWSIEKAK